ncbi:MAG TPA: hypothetical protein VKU02_05315 [Gemmataceae bacterium]|nr:hypothetical protein [Gemmataceae bacterium]
MDRFLVGFMTVALLLSSVGRSPADFRSVHSFGDSVFCEEQIARFPATGVDSATELLLAEVLHLRAHVFIVTSLTNLTGGQRHSLEPVGPITTPARDAVSFDPWSVAPRQFEGDLAFLAAACCLGVGDARLPLAKDPSISSTFPPRTEMLSSIDPVLAKFGGFDMAAVQWELPRVVIDLSGGGSILARLLQYKLLLGMSLLAVIAVSVLGYVVRHRRTMPHRALRGPRATTLYRSPASSNPRGTIR